MRQPKSTNPSAGIQKETALTRTGTSPELSEKQPVNQPIPVKLKRSPTEEGQSDVLPHERPPMSARCPAPLRDRTVPTSIDPMNHLTTA